MNPKSNTIVRSSDADERQGRRIFQRHVYIRIGISGHDTLLAGQTASPYSSVRFGLSHAAFDRQLPGDGRGQTDPPGEDGKLAGDPPAAVILPVKATVVGLDAKVTYAGPSPGLINGMIRVDVEIPVDAAPDISGRTGLR